MPPERPPLHSVVFDGHAGALGDSARTGSAHLFVTLSLAASGDAPVPVGPDDWWPAWDNPDPDAFPCRDD